MHFLAPEQDWRLLLAGTGRLHIHRIVLNGNDCHTRKWILVEPMSLSVSASCLPTIIQNSARRILNKFASLMPNIKYGTVLVFMY